MDTIFAPATARGKAGVSVVRISGPAAYSALDKLIARELPKQPRSLRRLVDENGDLLDEALVLCFDHGASFTGEETVELHLHGSPSILSKTLLLLGDQDQLRLAEPGEFTRRALENGKMDLAQVEGLSDLIDAETEIQRKQAIRVFRGDLGKETDEWRAKLLRSAALIEATIDFVDEDVPVDVTPEVLELVTDVCESLRSQINGASVSERIRDGFEVAIVGPPNVGKSTLLNALAGREAAITSELAGTTRDVIEVRMDVNGLPVTFLDTAGLRETEDQVEAIGVQRGIERAQDADLRVVLFDDPNAKLEFEIQDIDIVLQAKSDIVGVGISGLTGDGVEDLLVNVSEKLEEMVGGAGLIIRERHRTAMLEALAALENSLSVLKDMGGTEVVAEDIRLAIRSLETMIGRIDVESVLGEIFANFCLGK